jgi:hypothetical protein
MRPLVLAPLALAACETHVAEHPTWADVEPILRGNCTSCHGANPAAGGGVRFDFFALDEQVCGDAARAIDAPHMAHELAPLIAAAITPSGGRARMPPAPAPDISDGERETLLRWAADPQLGMPRNNHKPAIALPDPLASNVDDHLDLTLIVDDPDGESVVGVLQLGPQTRRLDGPGAFHLTVSTASWSTGRYPATATLCDGWAPVSYALPEIVVVH